MRCAGVREWGGSCDRRARRVRDSLRWTTSSITGGTDNLAGAPFFLRRVSLFPAVTEPLGQLRKHAKVVAGSIYLPANDDHYPVVPVLGDKGQNTLERSEHYNVYTKPDHVYRDGVTESDVKPMLDLVKYVTNLNEEHYLTIMDWLAFTVQHPDKKICWAPFFVSGHGIGKSTFVKKVAGYLVGTGNFVAPTADDIQGNFNGYLDRLH